MVGGLPACVLAALAGLSLGLRVGEQPSLGRRTASERAAREAGLCGKDDQHIDMARRTAAEAECDSLIPRYDMAQWIQLHGSAVPDHPAVFVNTGTHEAEVFPTMDAFLSSHGDERVVALPEYAQSGSHLKDPSAAGKMNATFRELANVWNDTFVYYSDFKCVPGSLCWNSSIKFGAPALFATTAFQSKNFLVGGPDSGLPFHKHGMTWQGLSMGRKAWYVLPPGSMTEAMHDETGPYIFPVRSYHGSMLARTPGERPLYCVQVPGEVFYVPEAWWHATMNLDRYQVAYGEKPTAIIQQKPTSAALSRMLKVFPQQAWDSAGYTSAAGGGSGGDRDPMPYSLTARQTHLQRMCGRSMDNATISLEEPLRRMKALVGSRLMRCGLAETAAFAHCEMARACERFSNRLRQGQVEGCADDSELRHELKQRAVRMVADAEEISPALVRREDQICHKPKVV